jgi:hypothetical protein
MIRITVLLSDEERAALLELARRERRDPREQAAHIIHLQLEKSGLLKQSALINLGEYPGAPPCTPANT